MRALSVNRLGFSALAVAAACGILSKSANANVVSWNGSTSIIWSAAGNWAPDAGHNPPLSTDSVAFSLSAYTNQPQIQAATAINGLSFTGSAAVTLSNSSSNALTIGSGGITLSGSPGNVTISAPVTLGADQTWTNGTGALFTESSAFTGNGFDLTLSGGGFALGGGGVGLKNLFINTSGSGVSVGNTTGGLNGTFIQNGTVTATAGVTFVGKMTLGSASGAATLDLTGNNVAILGGLLVDPASNAANQIVTNTGTTGKILTIDTSLSSSNFAGVIQNGGANTIGITKSGANTQTLSGINSYTGVTSGTRGTLEFAGQTGNSSQTLGQVGFASGGIYIESTYNSSVDSTHTTALNFSGGTGTSGAFAHTLGATGTFVINGGVNGSTNTITVGSATTGAGAIVGPWLFFGTGANTRYAIQTAGVISGFTGGTSTTDVNVGTTPTINYDAASFSNGTLSGNASANTFRYTGGAQTIDTTTNNAKLTINGLINAGSGKLTFTGNSTTGANGVVSGTTNEIVLNAATGDIEVGAITTAATANSNAAITLSGPNNIYLNQVNNINGGTGTLLIANGSADTPQLFIGGTRSLVINRINGTTGGTTTIAVPIADNPSGSSSVTLTGSASAGLTLSAFNTFTGGLINKSAGTITSPDAGLLPDNVVVVNAGGSISFGGSGGSFAAGLNDRTPDQASTVTGGTITIVSGRSLNLAGTGVYSFSGISSAMLTKTGTGTQILSGKNNYTGGTTVNGGTLELDFSQGAASGVRPLTNILYNGVAASSLSMGGGILLVNGGADPAGNSQSFSTLTAGSGGSQIKLVKDAGSPQNLLVSFTTASAGTGGSIDFGLVGNSTAQNASNGVMLVTANTAGILGGYATVNGADWAVSGGNGTVAGNITALPSGSYTAFADTVTTNTNNYILTTASAPVQSQTTNSLKITPDGAGESLTLGTAAASKTLTLTSGGLLFTGNQDYEIASAGTGANVSKLSATNLIVHQYAASNNLTISAVVAGTNLTKSGPGKLTLTGANTFSGTATFNGGVTEINAIGALGAGSSIVFNGGTLRYGNSFSGSGDITKKSDGVTFRNVALNSSGAVVDTNGNNITWANTFGLFVTQVQTPVSGFTKTGDGTLSLLGIGAYMGPTTISGGVLELGGGSNIAPTTIMASTGSTGINAGVSSSVPSGIVIGQSVTGPSIKQGAYLLSFGSTGFTLTGGNNGAGTFTFAGFSGINDGGPATSSSIGNSSPAAGNLILDGGTLRWVGGTQSTNRLFTLGSAGGGIDASGTGPLTFSSPGALSFAHTNAQATDSGASRVLTLTGSNTADNTLNPIISNPSAGATSLVKSGSGTWALAGTNAYSGATAITGGTLKTVGAGSLNGSSGVTINGSGAKFLHNSSVAVVAPITIVNGTIGGSGTISAVGGVTIGSNATISPGNSPAAQSYTTGLTFAGGGTYQWEINDATGAAGTNFDQLNVTGGLNVTASAGSPFTIAITSLNGSTPGSAANFNNASNYGWLIASSDSLNGYDPTAFALSTANFQNALGGGSFAVHTGADLVPGVTLDGNANDLYLTFSAATVPEPASLAVLGLGSVVLLRRRKR